MKKPLTFFNCAACVLATGSLAFAGSFNPELKPLGSMGSTQSGAVVTRTLVAGEAGSQLNRVAPAGEKGYVEKTVKSYGTILSYGRLTSDSPAKEGEEQEGNTTVNVTFTPVGDYVINPVAIGIIDEAAGSLIGTMAPEEGSDEFPSSIRLDMEQEGEYSALAYGELVDGDEVKAVAFFTTFEVSGETVNLTIDFNEATRKLAYQAYMGNGEPYPEFQPWSYGCGYNITYSSQLSYCGFYANFRVTNPMTWYVYCNEMPGSGYYSISYSANLFDDQIYCNLAGGGNIREFDDPENMVECIPASFYDNLSFSVSLSPADKEIGKETLVSGSKADIAVLNDNGTYTLQSNTMAMCYNDYTRQPVDNYQFYTWIPSSVIATGVQTSMIFTGFGAYNDGSSKYCGPRTRVAGTVYILPWEQTYNEAKDTYSPFCTIDRFNIRPGQQDIRNFVYPLYANSSFYIDINTEDKVITSASSSATYYGMFHEKMNFMDASVLKSFTIDDEEKEFKEILDVDLNGTHSIDLTYYNPDGFVQNMFPTEALNTLHITSANIEDMVPPRMLGLQMYNDEGKIKTVFEADEPAMLLVAMYDRISNNKTNLDFEVKLYVAAQESDEWVEISEPVVTEYDPKLGKTYEFTLPTDGTLSADQWMKLKVVGEDASGNSNTMLLDYCFGIGNPNAGVKAIEDNSADCAPVYYNLQGIRIAEPASGEIVIENAGGKTRKIVK